MKVKAEGKAKVLAPVRPNAGTEALYRQKLQALIDEMAKSVLYWIKSCYRANEPLIAQDELPSAAFRRAMRKLGKKWQRDFDEAAPRLATYFSQKASLRSETQLKQILRDAGISVKFTMTRTVQDVLNASIAEQVSLIKSIPQKFLTDVEGSVMRAVQQGGDLKTLTAELEKNYSLTRRRAAFIARDQNSKAIAVITRVRQKELGIKEAIWVHSAGGKTPRPTHVAAGARKQRYDITKGWLDPKEGKHIFPGELINCRCVSRPIIPGL